MMTEVRDRKFFSLMIFNILPTSIESKSHVTFQFTAEQNGEDDGTSKKDRFYFSVTGLKQVDFGKKDVDECLTKISVGVMKGDFTGELGCVAWSKIIW